MHTKKIPAAAPLAAALALALSVPAFAADPSLDAEKRKPTDLDQVEVIGQGITETSSPKHTQPLLNTPQTITVVPSKVIEQRAATSLREVLRNVSGISLVAGEGGGQQGDNLRIRGFGAGTDLFVDGIRDVAQYSRDPFNIEAVEVSKGPASAYSGRGSTGGSINLVSKAPRLREFANASLLFGTDQTKRLSADFNQPLGETSAFRVNVMTHEATVEGRDVVETERFGIAPTLSFGLGTDTRATISYFHMKEEGIADYGLPLVHGEMIPGIDTSNWYGFRDLNTEETRADIGTFKIEHDFGDTATLRNQTRYGRNERYSIVTPPRDPRIAQNDVRVNPTGRDSENTGWINQTDLTLRFGSDDVRHTIVTGLEIARENFDNLALSFPAPGTLGYRNVLSAPNPDVPFTGPRTAGNLTENRADTLAVYAFDTIELGEHWQLNGGVRHDRFEADSVTITPAGARTAVERDDSFTSWRGAVVYKPRANGSVYAAYGTSFNPSAESGVISAAPAANAAPTANASALVAPEENRSIELGTKWDLLGARLQLNAALFRTDKTNARTPGLPGELPTVLDGEQRVQGVELGAIGKLTEDWDIFAGYTRLDSEVLHSNNPLEQGNPIGNTPEHSFSLWTTYRLPGNVEIGAGAQYIGERTVSTTVTTELPSYWLFDAMVGWQANEHWDLRLNLFNLDDEFYLERVHGGGSHGVPGAGRTAMLSVNYKF